MSRKVAVRSSARLLLAVLPLACAAPPQQEAADACATRDAESQPEIECAPPQEDGWSEEALGEAREGMEERRPGGRP
jgi:hypothetical protein